MIRIVLAEDHHLVREAIRALLERALDMEIVGEAADGQEAVQLVERLAPDVLLLDIAMPRMDGIQAAGRIRAMGACTRVIILSMYQDVVTVRRALQSGARGYVLKGSVYDELLLAIRAVCRGEAYLAPPVADIVLDEFIHHRLTDRNGPAARRLTPRELEVLQLLTEGHSNAEIGEALGISPRTVERHRANILRKLDVHDMASLLREAYRLGLIFPGP